MTTTRDYLFYLCCQEIFSHELRLRHLDPGPKAALPSWEGELLSETKPRLAEICPRFVVHQRGRGDPSELSNL